MCHCETFDMFKDQFMHLPKHLDRNLPQYFGSKPQLTKCTVIWAKDV